MVLAYLFVLLWLLAAHFGMRQALRWWYQRQAAQRWCEAERIREGVLQELFAMRRSLEFAQMDDQAYTKEMQIWLTQIETIQHSLEAVTHRLSPPYLNDSLPLAIQHILKQWQATHPALRLELELPTEWNEEPIEQRRIILGCLNEMLHLIVSQPLPGTFLYAQLNHHVESSLMIQLTAPNVSDLLSSAGTELTHLQQLFQVLGTGKCYCQKQSSTVIWCCQWRSPCSNPNA